MSTPTAPPLNPDCRDGKCGACAGDAWDEVLDELTVCGCACHDQPAAAA